MKVWRAISLSIWAGILTTLLTISVLYFILSQTLLNEAAVLKQLDTAKVYETVRTQVIIGSIGKQVADRAPEGLISRDLIAQALSESLTADDLKTLSRPMLDAVYGWLDKKRPDASFTLSFAPEYHQFLDSLQAKLKPKIASLPVCATYEVDPEVLARGECVPRYTTIDEAVSETMNTIRSQGQPFEGEVSEKSLGLSTKQLGYAADIPDYLSYFWALNLITLPLAGLIALYLIIKRRGVGLIVVGSIVAFLSFCVLVGNVFLQSVPLPHEELAHSLTLALKQLVLEGISTPSFIGLGGGVFLILLGVIWHIKRRKSSPEQPSGSDAPPEELLPDPIPVEEVKGETGKRPLGRSGEK